MFVNMKHRYTTLTQRVVIYKTFSNSLIIHEIKTKENHKRDGFGNVIKHLHKLAKLSPSFSPEVRICLRSHIKHSHECQTPRTEVEERGAVH